MSAFFVGEIGRHVLEDRVLVEIIFDHVRHEIIHHLVVGDARADGIGERNISRAIRVNKPGHAQHRIFSENRRVEKIIVNAPVNDVNRLQTFRRAHEHARIAHEQIAAFDNFNAHLPREISVFKIRAVVSARREQHHGRVGHACGRDVFETFQKLLRVMIHRLHADAFKHSRKRALHRAAIFQNVTHAGRTTAIVFEHEITAVPVADQIRAANVDVNSLRHFKIHELAAKMLPDKT